MLMERLTGSPDGRIDHVLQSESSGFQEKTFQHLYLSALGSHTFILVAIIGEIMILLSSFSDICTVIYLKSLQLMILKGCLFDCCWNSGSCGGSTQMLIEMVLELGAVVLNCRDLSVSDHESVVAVNIFLALVQMLIQGNTVSNPNYHVFFQHHYGQATRQALV
uniref:Uncharacterized protein n=1 Tax=Oryza nivara TaxID=4536 RepID=A0A0E0IK83_ORYNI